MITLCRLCGSDSHKIFSAKVLEKYDVGYYKCIECNSIQTELPYWLDEAYFSNLSISDFGAIQRNIHNFVTVYLISKIYKIKLVSDYGGGDGFLCRLLRDYRVNCYVTDKYASPTYAGKYFNPESVEPQMRVAFEVIEHFDKPVEQLREIFEGEPKIIILSTLLNDGEDKSWWYFSFVTGQHIFLYSRLSMEYIANSFSYNFFIDKEFIVFYKKAYLLKFLFRVIQNKYIFRILKAAILILPAKGVMDDYES
jgi:hypothetical protein